MIRRSILMLAVCAFSVLALPPAFVPAVFKARPAVVGGGGGGCAASTNNPTADTNVDTWTRDSGSASFYTYVDDGRGVAGADFLYKFDDGATDSDTLRFEQPDGSCDVTTVAITAMTQSSAGTPGWAVRVSPDNATWTEWVTNLMGTVTAEDTAQWSVSWTAPTDVYVQYKTTTGDFSVARLFSIQALINQAP